MSNEHVVYKLRVNNNWKSLLLGLLLLLTIATLMWLFFTAQAKGWISYDDDNENVVVILLIAVPMIIGAVVQHKFRSTVVVKLSHASIEFQSPGRSVVLQPGDIASYHSFYDSDEGDNTVSVQIKPKSGKRISLTASTHTGSIEEMSKFRADFEQWAKAHNLVSKR